MSARTELSLPSVHSNLPTGWFANVAKYDLLIIKASGEVGMASDNP